MLGLAAAHAAIADTPADIDRYNLVWSTPSDDARGSMPIGNGDIGANVWVEPGGDLVFFLSKTDAWSENHRLLKLGKIRVTLDPPLDTGVDAFTQTLDLKSGLIRIESHTATRHVALRFWIDAEHPAVHLDVDSDQPTRVIAEAEPWRTERRQLTGREAISAYGMTGAIYVEPDTVVDGQTDRVIVYHRNARSIWADNVKLQALDELANAGTDPLLNRTFGFAIRGDGLTNASSTRLRSFEPRKTWAIDVDALTAQTDTPERWLAALDTQGRRVAALNRTACLAAHRAWWAAFWQRSWIDVSGDDDAAVVSRAYTMQRWIHACAGRGGSPIKFNGSIFNVDIGGYDADYRAWGGPYWWQNTRLPYWSMLSSGDYDLMRPLFKLYGDALPLRTAATKTYYDHGGAYFPEVMYIWGAYTDHNYGTNRKGRPDGLVDNGFIRREWQAGIELTMMMLDYHDHTRDEAFRDETLLPMAVAVTTFYDRHWPRDEAGRIRLDPAQALESWWTVTNPMPEIAGLHAILPRLIELPVDDAQKAAWRDMLADLPPVPTAERGGVTVLAPGEKYAVKKNTENAELYAVFPYRLYSVLGDPQRLQLARDTWPRRTSRQSGGWSQDPIMAAMIGYGDAAATYVTRNARAVARGFRFPAMWGPNFDWIPDQDHGSVTMTALQRMVMQTDGDKIRLLPAWPKNWNVRFKLHAPNATTVEGEYRDGKLVSLRVTPESRRSDVTVPTEAEPQ
ncbi:MAG: hypothetical protein GC159_06620 [Phycisphaera sp.]|nr:hypothetical protein [Phycisphaera sp.]